MCMGVSEGEKKNSSKQFGKKFLIKLVKSCIKSVSSSLRDFSFTNLHQSKKILLNRNEFELNCT